MSEERPAGFSVKLHRDIFSETVSVYSTFVLPWYSCFYQSTHPSKPLETFFRADLFCLSSLNIILQQREHSVAVAHTSVNDNQAFSAGTGDNYNISGCIESS